MNKLPGWGSVDRGAGFSLFRGERKKLSLLAAALAMLVGTDALPAATLTWAVPNTSYWEYVALWGGSYPTFGDDVVVINPGGAPNYLVVAPPSPNPGTWTGTGRTGNFTINSTTTHRATLEVYSSLITFGDISIGNRAGAVVSGGSWSALYGVTLSGSESTLTIANNGSLGTNAAAVGSGAGATAIATVMTGGYWFNDSNTTVGDSGGTGLLQIASSGSIRTDGSVILGNGSSASKGTLSIFGSGGSQGILSTYGVIESVGSGTLLFSGGILQARRNEADFISGFETGDVGIGDDGAYIDSNGYDIGVSSAIVGQGSLVKLGAGTLTLSGSNSYGGQTFVRAGTLAVSGGGVINSPSGTLVVGESSGEVATLAISSGRVTAAYATVGTQSGAKGSVTVSGGNLGLVGALSVGTSGTGTLAISGSGAVANTYAYIGSGGSGVGSATVSGGSWTNSADLYVGVSGRGTLLITGGTVTANSFSIIGVSPGASGLATISGGLWDTAGYLIAGNESSGTLQINGGLTVARTAVILGNTATGSGSVTLSGGVLATGSVFEAAGTGTLAFNGGTLRALGNQGAFLAGFEAGDATIGNGGAFLDSNGFAIGFSTSLSGSGGLTKLGAGSLVLSGSNSYLGGTTVTAGTLTVAHNSALGVGTILIQGGELAVQNGVTVSNPILLAGGTYSRTFTGNLAGAVNDSSDFVGGRDTAATIMEGTSTIPLTLTTSFAVTSGALNDAARESDVYHFSGMPVIAPSGETAMFVLQLSVSGLTADSFLGWLDTTSNTWVNAVEGNFGGSMIFAGNGAYTPGTDFVLGTYGVDTTNGTVWAVLNHNSDFAVVPEPATAAMLLLGGLALLVRRRR